MTEDGQRRRFWRTEVLAEHGNPRLVIVVRHESWPKIRVVGLRGIVASDPECAFTSRADHDVIVVYRP